MRLAAACAVGAGILLLAGLGAERAPLAPAIAPAAASSGDLAPSERHRRVMRLVSEVVERQHYRQTPLDDAMSSQIYERYLEALDGARSYLLASDIAEFEPLRYQLDDAIERADVGPAFGIFTQPTKNINRNKQGHGTKQNSDHDIQEPVDIWLHCTAGLSDIIAS
jgi:hypothetical protein